MTRDKPGSIYFVGIGIVALLTGCESKPDASPKTADASTSSAAPSAANVNLVEAREVCDALCDKIASCTEADRAVSDNAEIDIENAPPDQKAQLFAKEIQRQQGQVATRLLDTCRTNCESDPASDDVSYKHLLACAKEKTACETFLACAGVGAPNP